MTTLGSHLTIHTKLTAAYVALREDGTLCRREGDAAARYHMQPIAETDQLVRQLQGIIKEAHQRSAMELADYRMLFWRMDRTLQGAIFPNVGRLRKQKTENPSLAARPAHRIQRRLAKVEAAASVGQMPKLCCGGRTHPLILCDFWGKYLGVFKNEKQGALLEIAAYRVDEYFEIGLTPPTSRFVYRGEKGAFMVWERGYAPPRRAREAPELATPEEIELFQRMAIFDFLIGNLDRHYNNWLVKEQGGHITAIKTIDHGRAFSSLDQCGVQMYLWKLDPLARYEFTQTSRSLLQKCTAEKIAELLCRIRYMYGIHLSSEAQQGMHRRAEILLASAKEGCTPLHLLPRVVLLDPRCTGVKNPHWIVQVKKEAVKGQLYAWG